MNLFLTIVILFALMVLFFYGLPFIAHDHVAMTVSTALILVVGGFVVIDGLNEGRTFAEKLSPSQLHRYLALQQEAREREMNPGRYDFYNRIRTAQQRTRLQELDAEREQGRTRLTARRVYAGTDAIPGNAVATVYEFLGVPQRITRRGGPPSHTEREPVAVSRGPRRTVIQVVPGPMSELDRRRRN